MKNIAWQLPHLLLGLLILLAAAPSLAAPSTPVAGDGPVEVTADRLEVDERVGTLIFSGNAVAKQGSMTIYGDRLTIRYGGEQRDIESVTAEGRVRILHEGRTATGQKAVYIRAEEKIVLSGAPKVIEGENFVQGHEIVLLLKDGRSVVTGGGGRVNAVFAPKGAGP